MKEQYAKYLKERGYAEYTPSGRPSTVYNYCVWLDRLCQWENIDWHELSDNIDIIVGLYDVGGEKEEDGKKGNKTVINALKRFSEFVSS
jgi:hypothetical protein